MLCLLPPGTSPSGFYYHSATFAAPFIYVFGGGKGHKKKSSDLGAYDTRSNAWVTLQQSQVCPPMCPVAARSFTAVHLILCPAGVHPTGSGMPLLPTRVEVPQHWI